MENLLSLDGRIVVVSGAGGGGIGTTVTSMAARAGATVLAVSRSAENLQRHVGPLINQGLSIVPVAADASTDDGIATVMDHARRTDGDLYGLVNVAGGAAPSTWMPCTRVTRADWRALFTAEPRDHVLHEPGRRRRIAGAGPPRLDRVDLLDQRDEHGAISCRLWHGQGRGRRGDPNDGGRTGPGRHSGQRRGPG